MYRIVYHSETKGSDRKSNGRCFFLTIMLFCVFCWSVCTYWPEGKQLLQTLLIPGEPEITLKAAEVFASELSSGYTLSDALWNFCSVVFGNGYTS